MNKNLPLQKGGSFDYRIRISSRAQHVRLQISPQDGLLVVVPRYFDLALIPALLEKRHEWIEGHLRRFADMPRDRKPALASILPDVIELPALGESWQV
ncbi:MAG: YgjP-like metallopeptidase domain-containing protein, partial [Syntrophales bacterium]